MGRGRGGVPGGDERGVKRDKAVGEELAGKVCYVEGEFGVVAEGEVGFGCLDEEIEGGEESAVVVVRDKCRVMPWIVQKKI